MPFFYFHSHNNYFKLLQISCFLDLINQLYKIFIAKPQINFKFLSIIETLSQMSILNHHFFSYFSYEHSRIKGNKSQSFLKHKLIKVNSKSIFNLIGQYTFLRMSKMLLQEFFEESVSWVLLISPTKWLLMTICSTVLFTYIFFKHC